MASNPTQAKKRGPPKRQRIRGNAENNTRSHQTQSKPVQNFTPQQLTWLEEAKTWETNRFVVNVRNQDPEVYVGRGNPKFPPAICMNYKWGNPFKVTPEVSREEVCIQFQQYMDDNPQLKEDAKLELKGKTLGCWCSPLLCHAMILARIANS
mmetsp:Transcript_28945/g.49451  ORF Transcript_28945/g.49451 Transcript_28945/m.49451 type:complete len:152 (-) Transcript_28945:32-487(-)